MPDSIDSVIVRWQGVTVSELATASRAWPAILPEQMAALATLGRAHQLDDGRWLA